MNIIVLGEDRLERLSAMLAYMGGNPCIIRSMWSHGEGLPVPFNFRDFPRETYLAEEITYLKKQVSEARYWLTGGRRGSSMNMKVVEAFHRGQDYAPGTYEYGLGAGNYSGDLVSRNGVLYHCETLENCGQRLVAIAKIGEVA